jgi:hypothetical protein
MSEFFVLEELGSERSTSSESWHCDAQGEFGVTWRAEANCDAENRVTRARIPDLVVGGERAMLEGQGGECPGPASDLGGCK